MFIVWVIVAIAAASFCVTTGFLVVASARRVEAAGIKLHGWRWLIVKFWFYVGAVSDGAYNASIAWRRFGTLPHEPTYSQRLQKLVDGPPGKKRDKAIDEARFLNAAWGEPPHIKRVPK